MFSINPVALREMRQMARNKIVSSGLIAFLFIQLVAVMLNVAAEADGSSGAELAGKAIGQSVAATVCVLLDIVALGAIPLFFATRLTLEKSAENMDLQFATALRPAQFADGKIVSAFVLLLLCASATSPFLMLAYILRGMDVGETFAIIGSVILWSLLVICAGVFIASLNIPKALRFILMAGAGVFLMWMSLDDPLYINDELPFVFLKEWDMACVVGGIILSLCAILRSAAAANLAPPHTNGQRPLRRDLALVWLLWGALAVIYTVLTNEPYLVIWYSLSSLLIGGALMMTAVSSESGPSRRVASEVSRNGFRRRLQFLFFTGAEGGVCYALLFSFLTAAITNCAVYSFYIEDFSDEIDRVIFSYFTVLFSCYPVAFFITTRLIWQVLLRRSVNRKFVGFFGFIWMILASILPYLFTLGSKNPGAASYWPGNINVLFPGMIDYGESLQIGRFHAAFSAAWLLIAFLCYSPSVLKSFSRFRRNDMRA